MRVWAYVLIALLITIQWPLWFGKGGWVRVHDLREKLEAQRAQNEALMAQNAALAAELDSLKHGREAVQERARHELNMIREDEVFFQFAPPDKKSKSVIEE